ncbi:MAG: sulfatase-like hydrolase/transferase, partial [Pirellulaceae bacterium]
MKATRQGAPLHRRRLYCRQLLFLICLVPCCHPAGLLAQDQLPNIIILLADDLGYGELGCQGNKDIPTPHIDSIAKNGIRFTDGYVTAAYCSASR